MQNMVFINKNLATKILVHLSNGGSRNEADMLVEHLATQANDTPRLEAELEAAIKARVRDAVAAHALELSLKHDKEIEIAKTEAVTAYISKVSDEDTTSSQMKELKAFAEKHKSNLK